jgi:Protein of unknown function (DUF3574)
MHTWRIHRLLFIVFLSMPLFVPALYADDDGGVRCKVGDLFLRTELFFGLSKPDGEVTEEEFQQFLAKHITPRFPDGLTVVTGLGQFRNASGIIIQERSKLVILLYPPDQAHASRRIERIREEYKTLFQQESVLRADSRECVSF